MPDPSRQPVPKDFAHDWCLVFVLIGFVLVVVGIFAPVSWPVWTSLIIVGSTLSLGMGAWHDQHHRQRGEQPRAMCCTNGIRRFSWLGRTGDRG